MFNMGFILRAIFYTLLPRDKKARLAILLAILAIFGAFTVFSDRSGEITPGATCSGSVDVIKYLNSLKTHSADQFDPATDDFLIAVSIADPTYIEVIHGQSTRSNGMGFKAYSTDGTTNVLSFKSDFDRTDPYNQAIRIDSSDQVVYSTSGNEGYNVSCVYTQRGLVFDSTFIGTHYPTYDSNTPPPPTCNYELENYDAGSNTCVPKTCTGEYGSDSSGTYPDCTQYVPPDPDTQPINDDEYTSFAKKAGIAVSSVIGLYIVHLLRYRGEA